MRGELLSDLLLSEEEEEEEEGEDGEEEEEGEEKDKAKWSECTKQKN